MGARMDRSRRLFLRRWARESRRQRREESDAAAAEVQRVTRAFVGRARFRRRRRHVAAVAVQCTVRIRQACLLVALVRKQKRESGAATKIANAWRRRKAVAAYVGHTFLPCTPMTLHL